MTISVSTTASEALPSRAQTLIQSELASLSELYRHLHRHPELSFHEKETSTRLAQELEAAGFEVTTQVGGHGVVAVKRNGEGPTLMIRADMDALPVLEQTGADYSSRITVEDDSGATVPVMHACGHDMHMAVLIGTARVLVELMEEWRGTLLLIAQPAEERGRGARDMLEDGLYERFPTPDYAIALHVNSSAPAGTIAWVPGFALANVDMVDIVFKGVGGHGAYPHKTRDPVVLAAQAILAYQTIVSRETDPTQAAVVTVGSIHGGSKHNIIPDEVKLELTLRSYTDEVRTNTLASLERISAHLARAAGMPEEAMPVVQVRDEFTPATYNDPQLAQRLAGVFANVLETDQVIRAEPVMGGEDFGQYGRTQEAVPIFMFWLGAVNADQYRRHREDGTPLPSLHSPFFLPDEMPTLKTGVTSMTAAALYLLRP